MKIRPMTTYLVTGDIFTEENHYVLDRLGGHLRADNKTVIVTPHSTAAAQALAGLRGVRIVPARM